MYILVVSSLAFINFPVCMVICVFSTPIISILYGSAYSDVAPILSILSIWSLFLCIGNPVGNLAITKGRTDISFKYTLLRVLITVPVVLMASLFSVTGIAWGQVLVGVFMFFVGYRMLIYKLIKLPLKDYIGAFGNLMFITAIIGFVFYIVVNSNIFNINSSLLQLTIYGVLLFVVYSGVLLIFQRRMVLGFFKLIKIQ